VNLLTYLQNTEQFDSLVSDYAGYQYWLLNKCSSGSGITLQDHNFRHSAVVLCQQYLNALLLFSALTPAVQFRC